MDLLVRDAIDADLQRILAIFNDAAINTTAVWSLGPATLQQRRQWFAERQGRGFPILVAEADGEAVAGFGSFGDFRSWEGYLHTVEHSVYVDPRFHRQGLGHALVSALIARAQRLGKHVMVGGIEAGNDASLGLHERLGFREVGRMPEVGRKFDRWLDLVLVQKLLDQP